MFIIFVSGVTSLIIFSNSLFMGLIGLFTTSSQLLCPWSLVDVSTFLISLQLKTQALATRVLQFSLQRMNPNSSQTENLQDNRHSLLDLPDLPLHIILGRLSPEALCAMASVCTILRTECRNDYYWKKHLTRKWGRVLSEAVYNEWQCYISTTNNAIRVSHQVKQKNSLCYILSVLSMRKPDSTSSCELKESTMGLYLALESGKLWFPAQVYNRENGHAGFMLSCYDAKVRYECTTDTFNARYAPHGRQTQEENIEWGRLRAPVVNIPANALHTSDCMSDLQPGDHIEIQWRRNKEFPYGMPAGIYHFFFLHIFAMILIESNAGWWYGVVGHLETCDGVEYHCRCSQNDIAMLEFKQYAQGSRWRKSLVNRLTHREEGNTVDGFYGGIRKLRSNEEIHTWKLLWPPKILE